MNITQDEMILAFVVIALIAYQAGRGKAAQVATVKPVDTTPLDPYAWLGGWGIA